MSRSAQVRPALLRTGTLVLLTDTQPLEDESEFDGAGPHADNRGARAGLADDAAADDDDSITAPLVFQCAHCNTIVGDSFCMIGGNKALNTITLTRTVPCCTEPCSHSASQEPRMFT